MTITHDGSTFRWNWSSAATTFKGKARCRTATVDRGVVSVPDARVRVLGPHRMAQLVRKNKNRPRKRGNILKCRINTAVGLAEACARTECVNPRDTAGRAEGNKVCEIPIEGGPNFAEFVEKLNTGS